MPRTRTLARLFVFTGLAMFVVDLASAQVAIRERVEVDPAEPVTAATPPAAHAEGEPIAGYYVYRPDDHVGGAVHVVGGDLDASLEVTTTNGSYVVALAEGDGFPYLFDFPPFNCGDTPYIRRFYNEIAESELLRIPIGADEQILTQKIFGAADSLVFTGAKTRLNGILGCDVFKAPPDCECFDGRAGAVKGIGRLGVLRTFEGAVADTLTVELASESIPCGDSTAVTVVARDEFGSEILVPDTTTVQVSAIDTTYTDIAFGDTSAVMLEVPYSEIRAGNVYLRTINCEDVTEDITISVEVSMISPTDPDRTLTGRGEIILEPSPGEALHLAVSLEPDLLSLGETATVSVQVVDANGDPADVPDGTTLSLAIDGIGSLYGVLRRTDSGEEGALLLNIPLLLIDQGGLIYSRTGAATGVGPPPPPPPVVSARQGARDPIRQTADRPGQKPEFPDFPDPTPLRTWAEGTIIAGVSAALTSDPNVQGAVELGLVPCDASGSGFSVGIGIDTPLRQGDPATVQVQLCGAAHDLNSTAGEAGFAVWIGLKNVADAEGHWSRSLTAWLGNDWGPDFSGTFLDVGPNDEVLPDNENGWASVLVHSMEPQFEKSWDIGFIAGPYEVNGLAPGTYDSELFVELWATDADQSPGKLRRIAFRSSPFEIRVPGEPRVEMEVVPTPDLQDEIWRIRSGTGSAGPQMPNVQLRAQLIDSPDPDAEVEYQWTFTVGYSLDRSSIPYFGVSGLCREPRIGSASLAGMQTSPPDEAVEWSVPFSTSSMASFYASGASNRRGNPDLLDCTENTPSWQEANGWIGPYEELHPTSASTFSSAFVGTGRWTNGITDQVFMGGDVRAHVSAYVDGVFVDSTSFDTYAIRGEPLSSEIMLSGVSPTVSRVQDAVPELQNPIPLSTTVANSVREFEAIVSHESARRGQFNSSSTYGNPEGYPLYTNVNGMGLAQLDTPPATEMQLWNWLYNMQGGTTLYLKYRTRFFNRNLGDDPDVLSRDEVQIADGPAISIQEFVFKGAYAKYNGGPSRRYWRFVGAGEWSVREPESPYARHTRDAWEAYETLHGE